MNTQVEIIKAEIERRIETKKHLITNGEAAGLHSELAAEINCLQSLLGFINNMPEEVPEDEQRNEIDKMESVTNTIKGPHYNPKFKLWEIQWRDNDGSFGSAWGNSKKEVTEKFNKIMAENNT